MVPGEMSIQSKIDILSPKTKAEVDIWLKPMFEASMRIRSRLGQDSEIALRIVSQILGIDKDTVKKYFSDPYRRQVGLTDLPREIYTGKGYYVPMMLRDALGMLTEGEYYSRDTFFSPNRVENEQWLDSYDHFQQGLDSRILKYLGLQDDLTGDFIWARSSVDDRELYELSFRGRRADTAIQDLILFLSQELEMLKKADVDPQSLNRIVSYQTASALQRFTGVCIDERLVAEKVTRLGAERYLSDLLSMTTIFGDGAMSPPEARIPVVVTLDKSAIFNDRNIAGLAPVVIGTRHPGDWMPLGSLRSSHIQDIHIATSDRTEIAHAKHALQQADCGDKHISQYDFRQHERPRPSVFDLPGRAPEVPITVRRHALPEDLVKLSDIWVPHIDKCRVAPLFPIPLWGGRPDADLLSLFGQAVTNRFLTDEAANNRQNYFLDALGHQLSPGVLSLEECL